MRFTIARVVFAALAFTSAACNNEPSGPTISGIDPMPRANALGPQRPSFNLEVILRGDGFGLVSFRQPNDADKTIFLDVWVRGLAPNTAYVLQRAVDANVDDQCTSTAWLTLGKGLTPQSIVTDAGGTGREALFRSVASIADGSEFDIQFRLVNGATQAVVLISDCYQYVVNP